MGPLQATTLALSRWRMFSGRSSRAEFWWYQLSVAILILILYVLLSLFGQNGLLESGSAKILIWAFIFIFYVFILITNISVTIRRLHDTDRSGWWFLVNGVPYVGTFIVMGLCGIKGDRGRNRFGGDPLITESTLREDATETP